MALSGIALCSRALLKIGAQSISSFGEGSAEAEVAGGLYPTIRDALLSAHPWSFATGQATLSRLAAEPIADFTCAYQLPPDLLRVLSAGTGGQGRGVRYRIAQKRLHANSTEIVLTYIFRPAEVDFPAFFDQALIARLAAEFTIPITESTTRSQALLTVAEVEFKRARLIDSQQDTPGSIEDFTLADVRM